MLFDEVSLHGLGRLIEDAAIAQGTANLMYSEWAHTAGRPNPMASRNSSKSGMSAVIPDLFRYEATCARRRIFQ